MEEAHKVAAREDAENGGTTQYAMRVEKDKLCTEYARLLNWYDVHEYLGKPTDKLSLKLAKLEWVRSCRSYGIKAHRSAPSYTEVFDAHVEWFLEYETGLKEGHLY